MKVLGQPRDFGSISMILPEHNGIVQSCRSLDMLKRRPLRTERLIFVGEYSKCIRYVAGGILEETLRKVLPFIYHQV